jgi:glycosyltransferase involved in cell wall biosynthesis
MQTVSVLINTYNYGQFVVAAVESVLAQTLAPHEIIVVDDGSTDGTDEILKEKFGRNSRVKVIHQRNGGQLAAFVTGFEQAAGDFIFMLDADDLYAPGHLAGVMQAFESHREVDFVFTAHRQFGEVERVVQRSAHDQPLGFSLIGTIARSLWVGSVTSTLALRRSLVQTLLPGLRPLIPRWRIRADDCLVMGASLVGSQKYYLAEPTVSYRVHGKNHFHRQGSHLAGDYAHWLRRESLKVVFSHQLGIPADVANQVDTEFSTVPQPTREVYQEYVAIVWSLRLPLWTRLKKRWKLYAHFKRNS